MSPPTILPASGIEFREGGNTLWVHGTRGETVLRIKTSGKVTSKRCDSSIVSHADIVAQGDVAICIGTEESAPAPRSKPKPKPKPSRIETYDAGRKLYLIIPDPAAGRRRRFTVHRFNLWGDKGSEIIGLEVDIVTARRLVRSAEPGKPLREMLVR